MQNYNKGRNKDMKRIIFLNVILMGYLSCGIFKKGQNDCSYNVEKSLKSVAQYISMNKATKIYTLNYAKLPEFDRAAHQKTIDSLWNMLIFPPNDSLIKHAIYSKSLRDLTGIGCEISITDIRKYFGHESTIGSNDEKILWLGYYFNDTSYPDCYSRYGHGGPYSKCSTLRFVVNEHQILTKVITDYL